MWHDFPDPDDDPSFDLTCRDNDCAVTVERPMLKVFQLECPVPPCGSGINSGACVFSADRGEPVCTYCGRSGKKFARLA